MIKHENIPLALRERRQWLVWRYERNPAGPDKKPLKVPYYVGGKKRFGAQGTDEDRRRLNSLDAALSCLQVNRDDPYTGIGFAFLPGDGLVGIDIDHCLDPDSGEISPIAQTVLSVCSGGYTERSPSGTGLHVIMAGESDTFKSNKVGLEVFAGKQYFTVTCDLFTEPVPDLAMITPDAVAALRAIVRPAHGAPVVQPSIQPHSRPPRPLVGGSSRDEWRRRRIQTALTFIDPDDYNDWVKVGHSLKAEWGESAYDMWVAWSAKSGKFVEAVARAKWETFGKGGFEGDAGHIFGMAEDRGMQKYKKKASPPLPPAEPIAESPAPPGGEEANSSAAEPRSKGESNFVPANAGMNEAATGDDVRRFAPSGHLEDLLPQDSSVYDAALPDVDEAAPSPGFTPGGKVALAWAIAHIRQIYGIEYVWDSINKQKIKRVTFLKMLVDKEAMDDWERCKSVISPRDLPKLHSGVANDEGGVGVDHLLERFTYLYPTRTAWDGVKRIVVEVAVMELRFGKPVVDAWRAHSRFREIDLEGLVFDPTCKCDPEKTINMFEGLPLTPKRDDDKAQLVVELLWHLANNEREAGKVLDQLLCWLAYPLQHPGAKMMWAVLVFGKKQGTGKSLFFEGIYKPIFGQYGITGNQTQFEGQYTQWLSKKLFALFEELASPSEKYESVGRFKHLVTGRTNSITQKFRDDRIEGNYLNVAILSNMDQAVPIEPDDRRLLVINAVKHMPQELMDAIIDREGNVRPGIVEAFYYYLLHYDLGDFWPGQRPMMTDSKAAIIEYGLPDWEIFYTAWSLGELSVPYISCLTQDLHAVYIRWCEKGRYRSPLSLTKFAGKVASVVRKERPFVAVGSASRRQLMCFIVEQPLEDGKAPESIESQVNRFRDLADLKGVSL